MDLHDLGKFVICYEEDAIELVALELIHQSDDIGKCGIEMADEHDLALVVRVGAFVIFESGIKFVTEVLDREWGF